MSGTRLFVGNLPDHTSEDGLRKEFSAYGEVINLELKSKPGGGEEKKFAFVSLLGTNYDIESCIKHFSNENFNGNKLYVTRARESFLERLQRERQQEQKKQVAKNGAHDTFPKKNPVLKLSEKLNPRKRKNDDKVITDTNSIPIKNFKSFNTNNYTEPSASVNSSFTEKDKKKQDSDKKRLDSMKKKSQEFKQKQMIIKTGLVGIDKVQNKKIVFSDIEGDEEITQCFNTNNAKPSKKNTLFDDDEDSADDLNFEIKKQYEGKQGQKVLDLQSRYKTDKRFVLDERFVEDEKLDEADETQNVDDQEEEIVVSQIDEKVKQLNILQDVLGVAIKSHATQPAEAKDNKKKAKIGMLRFDPSQPEHAKFLAPKEETNQETQKKSKKKKIKDKQEEKNKPEQQEQEVNKVEVSKEQFYKVSDALKEAIVQPTTFSLRSLFGSKEPDEKDSQEQDTSYILIESSKEKKVKNPLDLGERNPFVYDSSDSEDELDNKETKPEAAPPTTEVKSVWKENLFFSDLDNRLKEGLDFFNAPMQSEGPKERRELKSVMKKRIYNKERKNQMFQKKIGGRKKTLKKSYRKNS